MQDKLKRREILLKRILYICAAVYIVTLLYAFYHNYTVRDMNALSMTQPSLCADAPDCTGCLQAAAFQAGV